MVDFLPIVAAVLTTVGAIVSGVYATRRLSKYGLAPDQLRVQRTLRELAEVGQQKIALLESDVVAIQAKLVAAQHDLDDCSRQRDNAYAELRAAKRRVPRADT